MPWSGAVWWSGAERRCTLGQAKRGRSFTCGVLFHSYKHSGAESRRVVHKNKIDIVGIRLRSAYDFFFANEISAFHRAECNYSVLGVTKGESQSYKPARRELHRILKSILLPRLSEMIPNLDESNGVQGKLTAGTRRPKPNNRPKLNSTAPWRDAVPSSGAKPEVSVKRSADTKYHGPEEWHGLEK